ncbi:hypothetical protein Smic_24310 [Streptomyces microflavus]|uniref:Uncharacterized protein n=1 Tax=Streptomyces microflavus TaxID=1919 RepID=A0A7J0CQ88_STRMI|nr:hypothetical protein Smic_24310 [Streptomyces microflavus]
MPNRNRHSAAYDAASSAPRSRSATVPFGPARSQSGRTRNVAYPSTSPSRSASTHCNGEAPARSFSVSITAACSHFGCRTGVPGRSAASRPYTSSQAGRAATGSVYRTRTSSAPGGSSSCTRAVSTSRLMARVAAPYPKRP